jgi:hypothetical protein
MAACRSRLHGSVQGCPIRPQQSIVPQRPCHQTTTFPQGSQVVEFCPCGHLLSRDQRRVRCCPAESSAIFGSARARAAKPALSHRGDHRVAIPAYSASIAWTIAFITEVAAVAAVPTLSRRHAVPHYPATRRSGGGRYRGLRAGRDGQPDRRTQLLHEPKPPDCS